MAGVPPVSYEYKPSKAEQKAEALLREKGWSLSRPACPDCHGMGYIFGWKTWGVTPVMSVSSASRPCPQGCPMAAMYYASVA
jgi:hypothetical protein